MMTTLADRFREAMAARDTNANRLAITPSEQSTIHRISTGEIANPRAATIDKFAKRLHVSLNWLMHGTGRMDDTNGVAEPLAAYNVKAVNKRDTRPVISLVQAGLWKSINDPFQPGEADQWEIPAYRSSSHSFWLQVEGDSMVSPPGATHSFPEGTLVHCDPDIEATVGRFVIAKNVSTQKATFKKLTSDGMMQYLTPLNERYPPLPIDSENIRIIATVTEWRIGGKL